MFHRFPAASKTAIFLLFVFALLLALQEAPQAQNNTSQIIAVRSKDLGKNTEITVTGSQPLISNVYELPQPQRIVIDVSDTTLSPDLEKDFKAKTEIIFTSHEVAGANSPTTRLEFAFTESFVYTVSQRDNEIILLINHENTITQNLPNKEISTAPPFPLAPSEPKDQIADLISDKKAIDSQLPDIKAMSSSGSGGGQQTPDSFNFYGYQRDRISVEFQKMDLHNVFNFLRQVSGVNIVVDESVQGSLTLVLDDVPWDFALDVILNLKDLEKEERFNTLVIYPKGKGFNWPSQAERNLSFEPDVQVTKREGILVEQIERMPVVIVEAQQKMALARQEEERENFETAVALYEEAYEKWPKNAKLANKISSIYLVHLRQNAKALYFAKQSLATDKKNKDAALNAAIAAANMQDKAQANKYFGQSVSGKKPSKEALISYAAFNEEQRDYNSALRLLEKHDTLYGSDLDSMISIARIYDKTGDRSRANEKYRAVLSSGFQISPDLVNFIHSRIGSKSTI